MTAISAYSLPAPASRVPIPSDVITRVRASASASGPESQDDDKDGPITTPRVYQRGSENSVGQNSDCNSTRGKEEPFKGQRPRQQPSRPRTPPEEEAVVEEEEVDPRTLANGALVATVIPGRLSTNDGPSFLVTAGVALTGIGFLPTYEVCGDRHEGALGTLLEVGENPGVQINLDINSEVTPRVLGMRAVVSGHDGLQALALLWAERPSFQVLHVKGARAATIIQEISLERLHRYVAGLRKCPRDIHHALGVCAPKRRITVCILQWYSIAGVLAMSFHVHP